MTSPQQITQVSDLPLGLGVRLITSNQHGLVALDKPAGLMSHPNKEGESMRSLLQASYDYDGEFYTWQVGEVEHRAWLINRLDSPTSGVILLALNEDINTTIKQRFSTHQVTKVYYALVKRVPSVPAGSWSDNLRKDVYRGKKLIKGGQSIPAKTRYQVAKTVTGGFPASLLRLMPLTGRTHQLRVHATEGLETPIVGDGKYGGSESFLDGLPSSKQMHLHARAIVLPNLSGGMLEVLAPPPEHFMESCRFLGFAIQPNYNYIIEIE